MVVKLNMSFSKKIIIFHLGFNDEHRLLCAQVEGELNKATINCEGEVVLGDAGAFVQPHKDSIWGCCTEPDLKVVGSLPTFTVAIKTKNV